MSLIAKAALAGDRWVTGEGYAIIWKQVHTHAGGKSENIAHYIWGRHRDNVAADPGRIGGGWTTAQWAILFPTYDDAARFARLNVVTTKVDESQIRIVLLRRQQPVEVLIDAPLSVLDALAEI